jgi:hypothetical protein
LAGVGEVAFGSLGQEGASHGQFGLYDRRLPGGVRFPGNGHGCGYAGVDDVEGRADGSQGDFFRRGDCGRQFGRLGCGLAPSQGHEGDDG